MMAAAAWEGNDPPPPSDESPSGRSSAPPGESADTSTPKLLHVSAQSTAKDSSSTPSSSAKKDIRHTVRVTLNLPMSASTGSKLAVAARSESPAGGEGVKAEPKSLDQEKEIALSQLQELEEAIKVRKVTKVDGRKIRWIEYRARKKEELEKAAKEKKGARRSKGSENSENDSTIVNNNNNNKSEGTMKVEVLSPPLGGVGKSNVLETMKQQFLQGTENVSEPVSNGKVASPGKTPEGNQKRKSNRTRKSVTSQKNPSPKGNTPKSAKAKASTLKEANGKTVTRRSNTPKGVTPKGVTPKGGQKGATKTTPEVTSTATSTPVPIVVSPPTNASTTPAITPTTSITPELTTGLKKPYFPSRSLTKGLREVRKVENGESPKKADDQPSGAVTPLSVGSITPIALAKEVKQEVKCPLIAAAARLISPPTARSRSLETPRGRKVTTRAGKKGAGKNAPRTGSEPRSLMNGHTDAQNGSLDGSALTEDEFTKVEEKPDIGEDLSTENKTAEEAKEKRVEKPDSLQTEEGKEVAEETQADTPVTPTIDKTVDNTADVSITDEPSTAPKKGRGKTLKPDILRTEEVSEASEVTQGDTPVTPTVNKSLENTADVSITDEPSTGTAPKKGRGKASKSDTSRTEEVSEAAEVTQADTPVTPTVNKSLDNTADVSMTDEPSSAPKKGRGRPPKRKASAVKEAAEAGKSSKKLSTVVVDVHTSMNGEPVIPVTKPLQRGKKSPTKKPLSAKPTIQPGVREGSESSESSLVSKQTEVKNHTEKVTDKQEEMTTAGTGNKLLTEDKGEREDTSASISNPVRLSKTNAKSTKVVKGVQKLASDEVPSAVSNKTDANLPSLISDTGNQPSDSANKPNQVQAAEARLPNQVQATETRKPNQVQATETRKPNQVQAAESRKPNQVQATETRLPNQSQAAETRKPNQVEATDIRKPNQVETTDIRKPNQVETTDIRKPNQVQATDIRKPNQVETTETRKPNQVQATETRTKDVEVKASEVTQDEARESALKGKPLPKKSSPVQKGKVVPKKSDSPAKKSDSPAKKGKVTKETPMSKATPTFKVAPIFKAKQTEASLLNKSKASSGQQAPEVLEVSPKVLEVPPKVLEVPPKVLEASAEVQSVPVETVVLPGNNKSDTIQVEKQELYMEVEEVTASVGKDATDKRENASGDKPGEMPKLVEAVDVTIERREDTSMPELREEVQVIDQTNKAGEKEESLVEKMVSTAANNAVVELQEKEVTLLKENNNLPEKSSVPKEIEIIRNIEKDSVQDSEIQEIRQAIEVQEIPQASEVQEIPQASEVQEIPQAPIVEKESVNVSPKETPEGSVTAKENEKIASQDVVEVSPSATSLSPETSASGAKSKEKVPRILKQLFQDEGVQNMLKSISMEEESGQVPEGSPNDSNSSAHKLRPKRASEPMLSSSPDLDALEALFSPTTKKKKMRSEVDNLYLDEGVLNLLTTLEPHSRRQAQQDDAASDISQASSVRSFKTSKSAKSYLDVQAEGRKRKLSGASTVSNTSTRSMQPPDLKKARLDGQEIIDDPYELDTAEEFREQLQPGQALEDLDEASSLTVRKRGRPTLPLSVKQKNKAIRIQQKLQKHKQMEDTTEVGALLKEDDNMNLAQLKDVLEKARSAFNNTPLQVIPGVTIEKAVPPLKIKLASDSVTIRPVSRPSQSPQTSTAATTTTVVHSRPVVKHVASDGAGFSRAPVRPTLDQTRLQPKGPVGPRPQIPDRRTPPPPHQRRIENLTSPTAESFSSLVKTLEVGGQQKNRGARAGESVRQSQRASVRQSEGNYHYRDISLRKFNNFTQIILSPSTTKMKNALNSRVLRELCEALQILRRDESVRMVLLTGTGSTFCQGIDLTALLHPNLDTRKKNAENLVRGIKDFLKVLVQFPKPIVAGVNGNAMGLGVTMLPLFDMVIANDKADFYLPYAKLGQVPEGGATYTFPNLFGKLKSTQLFLGHKVTAAKAQEMGLASESIWPATYQQELIPKVALLATQSAQSMEATKALMNHHLITKLELSLESECRLLLQQWTSPHFAHLCKRFLESHHVQLQKPVNLPL